MTIRKPRPVKARNHIGVIYPFDENQMHHISSALTAMRNREIELLPDPCHLNTEELVANFINAEDRDRCRAAPEFFIHNVHDHMLAFDFRMHVQVAPDVEHHPMCSYVYKRTSTYDTPLFLPKYVRSGLSEDHPLGNRIKEHIAQVCAIWDDYENINRLLSTLNSICRSVSDIVAIFPLLEVIGRAGGYTLRAALQDTQPVMRPTKMPYEMRDAWKRAVRTITRNQLLPNPTGRSLAGMWALVFPTVISQQPEWFMSSPGYVKV